MIELAILELSPITQFFPIIDLEIIIFYPS
jgi:hypothetical protein